MPSFVSRIASATVGDSPDLARVLSLPRRPPEPPPGVVDAVTAALARPRRPCRCASWGRPCVERLMPVQAWGLLEIAAVGGLLGAIGVGAGKTILGLLAPVTAPDCSRAGIFVPPGLVAQLEREYLALGEHFYVPTLVMPDGTVHDAGDEMPRLFVIPYSRLQRPEATAMLGELALDLLIADEAHSLKRREAVRTGRVLRHLAETGARLCAWSGTLTSRSLCDFAHLAAFALGEGSPLPLDPDEVLRWAAAVDPSDWPAPAGALTVFGQPVREALRRRIVETRGVVSTTQGSLPGASVVLRERPQRMPAAVADAVRQVRATMERPDGEELLTALQVAECVWQVTCGFYLRWVFPGLPDADLVERWFAARKAWGREMRSMLWRPREHLDSPKLLALAAERAERGYSGELPVWRSETWAAWRDVKDLVPHRTEAVWLDDYLARDAADWARESVGVVWTDYTAFGERVAQLAGVEFHDGGPGADARLEAETGRVSIVASIPANATGRDGLQRKFCQQLVTSPPQDGQLWEQLLGRLHRPGQAADEVVTYVYRHAPDFRDAVDTAVVLAKYVQGMTGNCQRLLAADVEWDMARQGSTGAEGALR